MPSNLMPPLDIVMATYQGAPYLRAQLDSIITQSYADFRLIIRDDGSTDETSAILKEYALKDARILLLSSAEKKTLGVKSSFTKLLESTTSDWVFFADQDDIWRKDKLQIFVEKISLLKDKDMPLLLHSDLSLIDASGHKIAASFWHYAGLSAAKTGLNYLLNQNSVTGCGMCVNRALLQKSFPLSSESVMHDWWLALTASCFGKIVLIDQPLVSYRQHGQNVVGAKKYTWKKYLLQGVNKWRKLRATQCTYFAQATAFNERYKSALKKQDQDALDAYCLLPNVNYFHARYLLCRYRLFKSGLLRNICHFFTPYNSQA